jgi:hypothetical protein
MNSACSSSVSSTSRMVGALRRMGFGSWTQLEVDIVQTLFIIRNAGVRRLVNPMRRGRSNLFPGTRHMYIGGIHTGRSHLPPAVSPCLSETRTRVSPGTLPPASSRSIFLPLVIMARPHVVPFAVLLAALVSCDSPSGSNPAPRPVPAQVVAASGTPQAGPAEEPLPEELVARVTDSSGGPVAGVAVAWSVEPNGGTVSAPSTLTDDLGYARVRWTLGLGRGAFTVRATVQGLEPAIFTATAGIPLPGRVVVVGGNGQDGAPGRHLPVSLTARVVSAHGFPVRNATVAWSVTGGGGSLTAATAISDAEGAVRVGWTLGAAGPNTVTATVGALPPAVFSAYAVPVASVRLSAATVHVGRGDTIRVTATPLDSIGQALQGRTVVWTTSSEATAVVSDGLVTGRALGTATVTATSEGKSAGAAVTVTTEDRTAPRLAGLTFSPRSVDVTAAARTVEFRVQGTDAGSGVRFFSVWLQGPTQASSGSCSGPASVSGNGELVSGTPLDGVWKCTVTLPKGAAAGTWTVSQVGLRDVAGNAVFVNRPELAAAGSPTTLTVVNTAPPATPPALTGLSFSPDPVNVGAGDATVEVTFTATASEGVTRAFVNVEAPGAQLQQSCAAGGLDGGTPQNGTWKCSLTIPHGAPGGTWTVNNLAVSDAAGTSTQYTTAQLAARGLPTTFQVVSPDGDVTAPVLTGVTLSPATVDLASGSAQVRVTLTATDAGVGVSQGNATLTPPSGSGQGCGGEPQGGPAQNATLVCTISIPAGGAAGRWPLAILLRDAMGNTRQYTSAQLQAAGLPHEVTVTR